MRKYLLFASLVLVALVSSAPPAMALHHGTRCQGHAGPDGDGGANVRICIMVNEHDFQWKIQPLFKIENNGTKPVTVHMSFLKLIKDGVTHYVSDTDVRTVSAGVTVWLTPDYWKIEPRGGPWYSRTREWVCWPSFAGDPCGSVLVWNSGSVTFP
jgi:hypothetical protein